MQVSRVKKKLKANAPTTRLWLGAVGQGSNSRHARGVIDVETDSLKMTALQPLPAFVVQVIFLSYSVQRRQVQYICSG